MNGQSYTRGVADWRSYNRFGERAGWLVHSGYGRIRLAQAPEAGSVGCRNLAELGIAFR